MEEEPDSDAEPEGSERGIDRRTYLTVAGVALAGATAGGADIDRTMGYGTGRYGTERYGW
ncbi:hypothetical protein [Halosimplex carlsbadense]|uniref:hypothetical protein n=1 Tax=Halosimplex carlsbadense TaxID=171164 RepID=UPI0006776C72|nr:hypothetical protein [Halosimplex carlsbadense]